MVSSSTMMERKALLNHSYWLKSSRSHLHYQHHQTKKRSCYSLPFGHFFLLQLLLLLVDESTAFLHTTAFVRQQQQQQQQRWTDNNDRPATSTGGMVGISSRPHPLPHRQGTAISLWTSFMSQQPQPQPQEKNILMESSLPPFQPPIYKKQQVETKFIETILRSNFLFQDLSDDIFPDIVNAFEKVEYTIQNTKIIQQGDQNADYLYIIGTGECTVSIDGKLLVEPFGTMFKGSLVGELGLLYNAPRAATITTKTKKVILYRLDRKSFAHFLYNQQRTGDDTTTTSTNTNATTQSPSETLKLEVRAIDQAIDNIAGVKSRYGGTIVRTYESSRRFLWRRFVGTILQHAWKATLINVSVSVLLSIVLRTLVPHTWGMGMTPDVNEPIIARLSTFGKAWQYLMSLTTFILTFFLSEAYAVWRDTFESIRTCQGRLNDVGLLLATAAKRDPKDGTYTKQAISLLDDVATYTRLFGAFMVSNFCKPYRVLTSARGLSRMLSRGLLTERQHKTLRELDPSVSPHIACIEWITARCLQGVSDYGALRNPVAVQEPILEKLCTLRGSAGSLGDAAFIHGRMPLPYVHFVQVLVDTFLIAAPFALYAELGEWSILAVGVLTLFYSGLLDLSKMFLDPLDNEDHYSNSSVNMDMGVLIREMNSGSTRWKLGAKQLPFL